MQWIHVRAALCGAGIDDGIRRGFVNPDVETGVVVFVVVVVQGVGSGKEGIQNINLWMYDGKKVPGYTYVDVRQSTSEQKKSQEERLLKPLAASHLPLITGRVDVSWSAH